MPCPHVVASSFVNFQHSTFLHPSPIVWLLLGRPSSQLAQDNEAVTY